MQQLFTDVIQVAMLDDGLNETHPIIQAASTPNEINELFDSISYEKVMCAVYLKVISTEIEPNRCMCLLLLFLILIN